MGKCIRGLRATYGNALKNITTVETPQPREIDDAQAREKFLKSGPGKKYVKNRLKRFLLLTGFDPPGD